MQTDSWKDIERAASQFCNIEPGVLATMIKDEEKIIADATRAKDATRGNDRQEWLRLHLVERNATADKPLSSVGWPSTSVPPADGTSQPYIRAANPLPR